MARTVARVARPALDPPRLDVTARGGGVTTPDDVGAVLRWVRGERHAALEDAAARSGVSRNLFRDMERATGAVSLGRALVVLASLGLDVVLVPRDPALSLRDPRDHPPAGGAR
jgi:hypothetical protein